MDIEQWVEAVSIIETVGQQWIGTVADLQIQEARSVTVELSIKIGSRFISRGRDDANGESTHIRLSFVFNTFGEVRSSFSTGAVMAMPRVLLFGLPVNKLRTK